MGGALGLRAARCELFGGGLSGAAREQPATLGVGPARTVGGVLWGSRGTRTANGRGVRPLGSGTRLEPSSADRPHLDQRCPIEIVSTMTAPVNIVLPLMLEGSVVRLEPIRREHAEIFWEIAKNNLEDIFRWIP